MLQQPRELCLFLTEDQSLNDPEAEGELPLFDVPNDILSYNVLKLLFDEVSEHSIENNLSKDGLAVHKDITMVELAIQ